MNKRGQLTIFIILGIIIVAVIVLLLSLKGTVKPKEFVPTKTVPLTKYVEDCIKEKGQEALDLVGTQGGNINPGLYQNYCYGDGCYKLSYLCYSENYTTCKNREPFLKKHVEEEIQKYVFTHLNDCVDFRTFKNQGYIVNAGAYTMRTVIGDSTTTIFLNYPITITKGDFKEKKEKFSYTFDVPLGMLLSQTSEIITTESSAGFYFMIPGILENRGEVEIERHKPGDSTVYILRVKDNSYTFQFATKGLVFS